MAEQYKKQHIVSQSYLNRFGRKNNKGRYIIGTRLNPKANNTPILFEENVDSVGYIKNYYDVNGLDNKKFWEQYFSKQIDSLCGQPLGNIIAKITISASNEKIISYKEKTILARIIISQSIKVPEFIDTLTNEMTGLIEKSKHEIIDEHPQWNKEIIQLIDKLDFTENARKGLLLEIMFNENRFKKFVDILVDKTWLIFYNNKADRMPFVTSDNPVIAINPFTKQKGVYTNGIGSNSTIIFYPLSPHIAVGIYPNIWFDFSENFDCRRYWIDDLKFLTKLNIDVVDQSFKQSFLPQPLYNNILYFKED